MTPRGPRKTVYAPRSDRGANWPRTRACACGRRIRYDSTECRWCKGQYDHRPISERFWPKVDKSGDCWLWIAGGDGPLGYGRIREGGRGTPTLLAHRVSYEMAFGPVPDGLFVCHHCDTPRCVRPDHLFVGTVGDNTRDAAAKGRMQHGDAWYVSRPWFTRRAS